MITTSLTTLFAVFLVIVGIFIVDAPQKPNKEINIGITVAEAQKFADEYRTLAQKHDIRKMEELDCDSSGAWKFSGQYIANYKENTLYKFNHSDSNEKGYAVGRECRWDGNSTEYLVHECFIIRNGGGKPCMHFQWTGYKD